MCFEGFLANCGHIDYVAVCPFCECGGVLVWDRLHDVVFCECCGGVLFEGGRWLVDLDLDDVD